MKLAAKQQIAFSAAITNIFIFILTLGAFTLFTRYLLTKNLNADLLIEAEEIVSQHLTIDGERITYVNQTTDQTLEQDLLTDRLSAAILNKKAASVGKFGIFAKSDIPRSIELSLAKNSKSACSATTYSFQNQVMIQNNEYIFLYYPIMKEGTCFGTVVVAGDTHTVNEISKLTLSLSVLAITFATVINLAISNAVATRVLKPLRLLSSKMQQIDLEKEASSITTPYTKNDEISSLIETFNSMAKRVNATAATQKSFFVDASHELKTPIARAVTDLDLIKLAIKDAKANDDATIEMINQSQIDLKSIAEIINTLLQATKLKQVALELSTCKLKELVESELEYVGKAFPNAKLSISTEIKNEKVLADERVLSIIIRNCLVNAFKYNVKEGTLSVKLEQIGNTFALIVTNTTSPERQVNTDTESYKLGFNIIQNLCSIASYVFTNNSENGFYTVTISNIPTATTLK